MSDDIYVLMRAGGIGELDQPVVAHTRQQGAAMEMAGHSPEEQRKMWVQPIELIDDGD